MEYYTYLGNDTDLSFDGKLCERRFGQSCKGPIIPFGSLVEYHTLFMRKTGQESINLEKKGLTWIVSRTCIVRGENLKGDVLVADVEELETMDASEIYSKRLNDKRGDISQTRRILSNGPHDNGETLTRMRDNSAETRLKTTSRLRPQRQMSARGENHGRGGSCSVRTTSGTTVQQGQGECTGSRTSEHRRPPVLPSLTSATTQDVGN